VKKKRLLLKFAAVYCAAVFTFTLMPAAAPAETAETPATVNTSETPEIPVTAITIVPSGTPETPETYVFVINGISYESSLPPDIENGQVMIPFKTLDIALGLIHITDKAYLANLFGVKIEFISDGYGYICGSNEAVLVFYDIPDGIDPAEALGFEPDYGSMDIDGENYIYAQYAADVFGVVIEAAGITYAPVPLLEPWKPASEPDAAVTGPVPPVTSGSAITAQETQATSGSAIAVQETQATSGSAIAVQETSNDEY